MGVWHRKKDPSTGAYYYANSETLSSSWTVPPEWVEPPAPEGAPPALTVAESWREVTDSASGLSYYVNTMTMESSWTKPAAMKETVRTKLDMPQEDPDTSDDDESHREKKLSHSSRYESKEGKVDPSPRLRQAAVMAHTPWLITSGDLQRERIEAIRDLLADERAYFVDLQVIATELEANLQAQKALGKETLTQTEMKTILKNIPDLYAIHLSFAQHVASLTSDAQILSLEFCRMFQHLVTSLEPYSHYISSQKNLKTVLAFVDRLEADRPGFKAALDLIKTGKCKSGESRSLQYYLELPCARPSAYGNLILNVLKTMDPTGDGFRLWNDLLEASEVMAAKVEQGAQFIIARDLVADIQKRLHFVNAAEIGLKLVTPTRYLVQSGEVRKKLAKTRLGSSYKAYMFYVFNDMAMYTSVPDKLRRIVPKRCMPMLGMKVVASVKDVNFTITSMVKNVQLKAANKEERDQWVRVLQSGIKRATEATSRLSTGGSPIKPDKMLVPVRGW